MCLLKVYLSSAVAAINCGSRNKPRKLGVKYKLMIKAAKKIKYVKVIWRKCFSKTISMLRKFVPMTINIKSCAYKLCKIVCYLKLPPFCMQ